MKSHRSNRFLMLAQVGLVSAFTITMGGFSHAAMHCWDDNDTTANACGGLGTWATSTTARDQTASGLVVDNTTWLASGTGITATISSVIAGAAGLTTAGAGTLTLSGASADTLTGNTTANSGALVFSTSDFLTYGAGNTDLNRTETMTLALTRAPDAANLAVPRSALIGLRRENLALTY